jgi:chemotaxis protein MotB
MAKKPHAPHDEHQDEGWLLPYSDMMTLLLALFIVMYAVSSVDQAKFNAMMEAMYTAFGGTTTQGVQLPLPYPDAELPLTEETEAEINPSLQNLYLSLNSYVIDRGLQDSIAVQYSGSDILVTIKNDVFFASASADLTPELQEQAKILARLLHENQDPLRPFDVIVAGHTDDVPINNIKFPSNWHLSAHRALNFLDVLLTDSKLDPTHFSSRGYGEYAPVATNDTPEGRQQNRRVELLISQPTSPQQQREQTSSEEGALPEGAATAPAGDEESTPEEDPKAAPNHDAGKKGTKDSENSTQH